MRILSSLAILLVMLARLSSAEANGDPAEYEAEVKKAEERIPAVIEQYATSIGCAFHMKKDNIVPYVINGEPSFVGVFSLDNGCTGGSAMSRPVFVVVQHGGPTISIVVNAEYSAPHQTSSDFPQVITDLFLKDGELWYKALEFDFKKDANCCPSVPVTGRVVYKNGKWQGIPVKEPSN